MIELKLLHPEEEIANNSPVVVTFSYSPDYVNAIKRIDKNHRKWFPEKKVWVIAACEVKNLADDIGLYNISMVDDKLRDKYTTDQDHAKQIAEREKIQTRLENTKQKFDYDWNFKPFKHQVEGFNEGMIHKNFLLCDEQGLGKTATSLAIAEARYNAGLITKCLIVCCVNSTKYNWGREIEKYTKQKYVIIDQKAKIKTKNGEKTTLLTAEESKIRAIEEWKNSDALFAIVNIEMLRPDCKWKEKHGDRNFKTSDQKALDKFVFHPSEGCNVAKNRYMKAFEPIIETNMVIVDEIHKCKNIIGSRQGVALQQLQAFYRIGLSGTPITNRVMDIWNILIWLGAEYRNYYSFREEYCIMGGYSGKEIVGHKNLNELHQRLTHVMLRRRKDDVLDLPDKIHHTEFIDLSPSQKKMYKDTRKGILKVIDSANAKNNGVYNTEEALVQLTRLRQITDGVFSSVKDNTKLSRVKELVEEITESGNKAIIFSNFEMVTDLYKQELEEYNPAYIVGSTDNKKRQAEVDRFQNDPNCKIIIGTIGAMGTGLTLTAGSYVIFIDKYWNPSENAQAEDRAHRIGTKSNVTVITMVGRNTIDERIEEMVGEKAATASAVVDGIAVPTKIPTGRELVEQLLIEYDEEDDDDEEWI